VLSRDQLRRAVFGRGAGPDDRSVDMLIARLRRKIEPNPKAPRFIRSVPGVGYKFAVQPQIAEHSNALAAIPLDTPAPPDRDIASRHCEPERRQLTALSCALVGLGALDVSLDPEDLVGIIQRFQDICTTVITSWGGVVANSAGDEILALFGYPMGLEDHAERAVHAAFNLVANMGELSSSSGEPLQTRIAVASGSTLIGENQTVVGEATIMAGRLRHLTPPNSVNVTDSTRTLLSSVFICDDPQLCKLEGISEPVTAYRVTGKREIESRFIANRKENLTPFIGRQHELQQMMTLWEQVKAGKGQVLLLRGEAGIGKSRLFEAWLDRIADEPHITIRNQCSPYHINSPFYPITSQLKHAARFEREDTPEVKLRKLETLLSQADAATPADIPFFAGLLAIPTDGFYSSQNLTPQRQRDLTIEALLRQVLGLALARPVVINLADAQWIDSSTLELLGRCIASIKTARVFILCSFRPEFFPRWLDEPHVTMLHLDRLSREQIESIIFDAAGHKPLPGGLYEQIIGKADGVPLFAEELTKTVLESGLLQDAGSRYVTLGPLPSLTIPTTLQGSLSARIDGLGPSKEIAQIGAAIGRDFSYRLLAAVAPASDRSLQTALAHIAACGVIFARGEPRNSTYIFKHALLQEAAYATMVRSRRQQLHGRIADALMEVFPETVETQPELMAHHLAQAGLTVKAIECLRKAGQRAIEQSANAEAIGHLTRALELLPSLPDTPERRCEALALEVMLGQATIASRGYAAPETEEIMLRAKSLIDDQTDPSQKFGILYGIWAHHYGEGEAAKQRDAAAEFLAEAERHNDRAALCIAHRAVGTTYVTTGEFAEGLHHLERARALYDAQQHSSYRFQYGQDIGVAALCYLSWAQWHLGYVDQASEVAAEAMRRAEELSHPHTLVYAICHARGCMDIFRGRCEDTQSYAALVVSLCIENGFSQWINCGRILEGWAEICGGKLEQGIETLRAGAIGWRQKGARAWLPMFLALEAEACIKAGRPNVALKAIEEAIVISKDTGERWALAEVLRVKARALQAAGRANAETEAVLLDSLEIARGQRAICWELRAARDLGRLWQSQGRVREALKLIRSAYDQFSEGFDTENLRTAKELMGSLQRSADRRGSSARGSGRTKPHPSACRVGKTSPKIGALPTR
jgi:class 3 adenylate cyclase/predicted ATPase